MGGGLGSKGVPMPGSEALRRRSRLNRGADLERTIVCEEPGGVWLCEPDVIGRDEDQKGGWDGR